MKNIYLLFLMTIFYLLISDVSAQQSFSLDTEFSEDGVVYFDSSGRAKVQLQSDGKVIVMTQDTLYRLNVDGSRDMAFGNSGVIAFSDVANNLDGLGAIAFVVMPENDYIAVLTFQYNAFRVLTPPAEIIVYDPNGNFVKLISIPDPQELLLFYDIIAVSPSRIWLPYCDTWSAPLPVNDIFYYDLFDDNISGSFSDGIQSFLTCPAIIYQHGYMITSMVWQNTNFDYLQITKHGDNNFADNGVYRSDTIPDLTPTIDVGGEVYFTGTHLYANGKLVYAYQHLDEPFIKRLNADGTLDLTFNTSHYDGGRIILTPNEDILSIKKDSSGAIILKLFDGEGNQISNEFGGDVLDDSVELWSSISTDFSDDGKILIAGWIIENQGGQRKSFVARFAVTDPLPIEMTASLRVYLDEKAAILSWRTDTETNNAGFEIQRGKDGISWERIGWQVGQGTTTSPHSYIYKDTKPLLGTSYYRLKQVDFDGNFEYSSAVSLRYIPTVVEISPNPVKGIFQVNGISQGTYQIQDAKGRIIQSGNMKNNLSIDISQEAKGVYFISIHAENEVITRRIIKL